MSGQRLGTVVAVAAALIAVALPASACSCIYGDPRDRLVEADGAFIGELTAKQQNPDDQNKSVYTFRVIEGIKGRFGKTEEVHGATYGASCGLEMSVGRRAGLFLYRNRAGNWTSSLCSTISPRGLREAATPLPRPNGSGEPRMFVGGSFGKARVVALNAAGKTLDYGFGGNQDLIQLDVCPGSQRTVEVSQGYNERRHRWRTEFAIRAVVGTRELRDAVARFMWKKRYQYFWPHGISCQSRDASEAVVFISEGYGIYTKSALVHVRNGRIGPIDHVTAREAEFGDGVVYLSSGKYGRNIASIDLATGRKRVLFRGHRPVIELQLSPDGSQLIGIEAGNCFIRSGCAWRLILVDVGSHRVKRLPLSNAHETVKLAWWGNRKIIIAGVGKKHARVHTYNLKLDRVGVTGGRWYARDPVVLEGRLYGVYYSEVYRVRLPSGWVHELGDLPSPVTNALAPVG